jgi:hypothetical protein
MKKIKLKKLLLNFGLLSLSLVTIFGAQLTLGQSSSLAADPKTEACITLEMVEKGATRDVAATTCSNQAAVASSTQTKISAIIGSVINILSMLVGAVSVIMIIIGGFKYVTSNGDASSTKSAKDTVMYALIGLLLVGFAQTLVRFVWSNT